MDALGNVRGQQIGSVVVCEQLKVILFTNIVPVDILFLEGNVGELRVMYLHSMY